MDLFPFIERGRRSLGGGGGSLSPSGERRGKKRDGHQCDMHFIDNMSGGRHASMPRSEPGGGCHRQSPRRS
jgi:hypothetical protein